MNFTLVIKTSPAYQAGMSAFHFAQAAFDKNHHIPCIFFMQEGVYHAQRNSQTPSDEWQIQAAWRDLSQAHDLPLLVCISAAERRGILLDTGFQMSSLTQLMDHILHSHHTLQFGG